MKQEIKKTNYGISVCGAKWDTYAPLIESIEGLCDSGGFSPALCKDVTYRQRVLASYRSERVRAEQASTERLANSPLVHDPPSTAAHNTSTPQASHSVSPRARACSQPVSMRTGVG